MKSDEAEETQREVEQELGVMDGQPVSTEDTGDEIMTDEDETLNSFQSRNDFRISVVHSSVNSSVMPFQIN